MRSTSVSSKRRAPRRRYPRTGVRGLHSRLCGQLVYLGTEVRLGVKRVEDLILVSGCTLVTSWAAAAFVDDAMDAEISLASRKLNNGGASFVWSNIRGSILYHNSRFELVRSVPQATFSRLTLMFFRSPTESRNPPWLRINVSSSGAFE